MSLGYPGKSEIKSAGRSDFSLENKLLTILKIPA